MINTINEARTPGELVAWLRQWADGADASDYLDDNDARQLAEAVERVCAPGNAAAMREALEESLKFLRTNRNGYFESRLIPHIEAALAAPARNCDRPFRSVNEALGAYVTEHGDGPHLGYCDAIEWALAPAKKGGAS